jgi:alanine racemase
MNDKKAASVSPGLVNRLDVNWEAIRNNLHYFHARLSNRTRLIVMLKANAYGMGATTIAKKIEEESLADYFGIAQLQEGIALRKAGISLPIILFNPLQDQWESLVQHKLEPVLYSLETLTSFASFLRSTDNTGASYPIHLEFNTGMNRLGMEANKVDHIHALLKENSCWKVKSVMTHLSATGMEEEDAFTAEQIRQFDTILEQLNTALPEDVLVHSLNSNGIERLEAYHFDMVRLGIGLYGASALPNLQEELSPICQLISHVADIRPVKKGASIGYSRSGRASKDTQIATLPIGYADGLPRKLGNGKWLVEINGELYPTIGNICMDLCMIDVGNASIQVNDEVVIFGRKKSIFDYAKAMGTITYEALAGIGSRVHRRLVENLD